MPPVQPLFVTNPPAGDGKDVQFRRDTHLLVFALLLCCCSEPVNKIQISLLRERFSAL